MSWDETEWLPGMQYIVPTAATIGGAHEAWVKAAEKYRDDCIRIAREIPEQDLPRAAISHFCEDVRILVKLRLESLSTPLSTLS